jgi:ketosteroid isomerase-like protein
LTVVTQETIERACQVMAALSRRDLEALLALADRDVEWPQ